MLLKSLSCLLMPSSCLVVVNVVCARPQIPLHNPATVVDWMNVGKYVMAGAIICVTVLKVVLDATWSRFNAQISI